MGVGVFVSLLVLVLLVFVAVLLVLDGITRRGRAERGDDVRIGTCPLCDLATRMVPAGEGVRQHWVCSTCGTPIRPVELSAGDVDTILGRVDLGRYGDRAPPPPVSDAVERRDRIE